MEGVGDDASSFFFLLCYRSLCYVLYRSCNMSDQRLPIKENIETKALCVDVCEWIFVVG